MNIAYGTLKTGFLMPYFFKNRCLKLLHTPKALIEQEEDNPQNVKKNNR